MLCNDFTGCEIKHNCMASKLMHCPFNVTNVNDNIPQFISSTKYYLSVWKYSIKHNCDFVTLILFLSHSDYYCDFDAGI